MAPNDLQDSLRGRKAGSRSGPRPLRRPVIAPLLVAAGLVVAVVAGIWIAVVDDPDGGQAVAVASVQDDAPETTGSIAPRAPGVSSGKAVQTAAFAGAQPGGRAPAGAPPDSLVEVSAYGPLPRVGSDGTRPLDAYSRPAPAGGDGKPRVAIVISGLGISQTGTEQAIRVLPEDITLAFASYGSSLQRWVDKARLEGHEVLLQLPLEPTGYPQQNPGEHTILASADPATYADDLAWNLGRMTSYAGVMNYMGGRFTEDASVVQPFLGVLAGRGLYYLDDGSSLRSVAPDVGRAVGAPVVGADVVLDEDRSAEAIERNLSALEVMARERGIAVGVASAFPVSTATIGQWARRAGERGIVLVPASAAIRPNEPRG